MSSNVDDLEGAEAMNSVLHQFLVEKEEHGTFRVCGKDFRQDEDFGIHVTAKDNSARVQPITYDVKDTKGHRRYTSTEIRHTVSRLDRKANTT